MNNSERLKLVAPCGIDCAICEMHTCTEDSELYQKLISRGISKDQIPCMGCRSVQGLCPVIPGKCATFDCVSENKLEFCYECKDFPCLRLHPSADRAEILPHNQKMYNLCHIKNKGLESFVLISDELKQRYYKGKMAVGSGPQI